MEIGPNLQDLRTERNISATSWHKGTGGNDRLCDREKMQEMLRVH